MTSTDEKRPPRPPGGLESCGRALWRAVVKDFDLDRHELITLQEACRTADLCDGLQQVLDGSGLLADSSQGIRVHPAAVELRQQRVVLARLLAALHLPVEDDGVSALPNVRAPRGVYGLRGVS